MKKNITKIIIMIFIYSIIIIFNILLFVQLRRMNETGFVNVLTTVVALTFLPDLIKSLDNKSDYYINSEMVKRDLIALSFLAIFTVAWFLYTALKLPDYVEIIAAVITIPFILYRLTIGIGQMQSGRQDWNLRDLINDIKNKKNNK